MVSSLIGNHNFVLFVLLYASLVCWLVFFSVCLFVCLFDCYVSQPLPSSPLVRYDGDGGDDEQIFKLGLSFL